jgi:hypothetical protein
LLTICRTLNFCIHAQKEMYAAQSIKKTAAKRLIAIKETLIYCIIDLELFGSIGPLV